MRGPLEASGKRVPALHRMLVRNGVLRAGMRNLDIGGGYYELGTSFLARHGVENLVFDPFNRDEDWNRWVVSEASRGVDMATVSNVLNVIEDAAERARVIEMAGAFLRNPWSAAWFRVHEGDRSGRGRTTSRAFQANRRARSYEREIARFFGYTKVRPGPQVIEAQMPRR